MTKPIRTQDKQVVLVNIHHGEEYVNKLLEQGYKIESMEGAKEFVLVYLVKEVESK